MIRRLAVVSAAAAILTSLGIATSAGASAVPSPLPCASTTGGRLTFLGGGVAADAQVYIIYWGSWWKTKPGRQAESSLNGLFSGLGATPWARTITQYCDNYDAVAPSPPLVGLQGASELAGTHVDASHVASPVDDTAIQREAVKYAPGEQAGHKYPIGLPIPVVVTPKGTVDVASQSQNWLKAYLGIDDSCSYHGWMQQKDGEGGYFDRPYIALDYGAILSSRFSTCKPAKSDLGSLSVYAGHEWAETLTDPYVGLSGEMGWYDPTPKTGGEIGDVCLWSAPVTQVNGYAMQELWSDKAGRCVVGS